MAKVIKEGFCFRHSIFDMELSLIPVPFANLYWLISPRASRSFSTTLLVMLFACRLFMMSETISSFRNISKYFTGKLQLLGRKFFKFVNGGIKQRIFPQQLVLHKLRFRIRIILGKCLRQIKLRRNRQFYHHWKSRILFKISDFWNWAFTHVCHQRQTVRRNLL